MWRIACIPGSRNTIKDAGTGSSAVSGVVRGPCVLLATDLHLPVSRFATAIGIRRLVALRAERRLFTMLRHVFWFFVGMALMALLLVVWSLLVWLVHLL